MMSEIIRPHKGEINKISMFDKVSVGEQSSPQKGGQQPRGKWLCLLSSGERRSSSASVVGSAPSGLGLTGSSAGLHGGWNLTA